jgi:transcriptional regulator with XRE-family HTH domain
MKLKVWLKDRKIAQRKIACDLGLSASYFSELLSGKRRFSPKLAKKVEDLTKGEVMRMDLLYPESVIAPVSEINDKQPDFLERGSPLTPETRSLVLKGELRD